MTETPSDRKRKQRKRDKEDGIKQLNIRVHKDDELAVKAHASALLEKRLKQIRY